MDGRGLGSGERECASAICEENVASCRAELRKVDPGGGGVKILKSYIHREESFFPFYCVLLYIKGAFLLCYFPKDGIKI